MMRVPNSTYRIQITPTFGFQRAGEAIPYLAELGISDVYASPVFRARRGSPHGYDVVDPTQLNPELGAPPEFHALMDDLHHRGMGWLQDVVPNHMAFDSENRMLMDVLENGSNSEFFRFFDIEWDHPYESMKGRLLAPFLGGFYGDILDGGEIALRYGSGGLAVHYYDLILPLKIESYLTVFAHQLNRLRRRMGGDHPDFVNFLGVLYVLKTLATLEERGERSDQIKFIKTTLWELHNRNREIRRFMDENIDRFNGDKGRPETFDPLNALLSEQLFRLSFWKVATEEINYRRFFNINQLISLRLEDPDVFDRTHSLIFQLVEEEKITGLRIDHIDGLYDPTDYLEKLREKAGGVFLVVEKILHVDENLPSSWPVQGTTGYDFLNSVTGLFCRKENERALDRIYRDFAKVSVPFEGLLTDKKRMIIGKHMAGDIDRLAHLMKTISSRDRYGSDITIYGLRRALVEVMAQFPVYRTYFDGRSSSATGSLYVTQAVKKAMHSSPGLSNELQYLERFLLLDFPDYLSEEEKGQWLHFAMRFQQQTGPLMAKGFEDTTLYVYNRLLALNEVGGDPSKFGIAAEAFHAYNERRLRFWPHSLSATATHDTKRGEDVRMRIDVLSEIPREWSRNVKSWSRMNRKMRKRVRGLGVPDRNDEYFLYQTMVGSYPFHEKDHTAYVQRLKDYVTKAVREAKVHTAWLKPDMEYEEAYIAFVEQILDPAETNPFLHAFLPFQNRISYYGMLNSLSQTLLKITSPGVPDFYQGTELWDLSLVDPDNRRPVDFAIRTAYLQEIQRKDETNTLALTKELRKNPEDGRIKLFLIYKGLAARNRDPEIFQKGTYVPLEPSGRLRNHLIAFARQHGGHWAITIAPRFFTALVEAGERPFGHILWDGTHLLPVQGMPSLWRNAITGRAVQFGDRIMVGEVLQDFPVALLTDKEAP